MKTLNERNEFNTMKEKIPKSIIKFLEFMKENGNYNKIDSDEITKFISVNKIRLKNVNFAFIGIDMDEYQILFDFFDSVGISSTILINQFSFESKEKPLRDILLNINLVKHSENAETLSPSKLSYIGELEVIYMIKTIFRPMYLEEYVSLMEDKNDPIFDPDIIKPLLMDTLNIEDNIREKIGSAKSKEFGGFDFTRSWDQLFDDEFLILGRECIKEIKSVPIHIGRIPFDFDPMVSRLFHICYSNMLNNVMGSEIIFSISSVEKMELIENWLKIFNLARLYDKMYFLRYNDIPKVIFSPNINSYNQNQVKVMKFDAKALILVRREIQKLTPLYFDPTEENIEKFRRMDKGEVIEEISNQIANVSALSNHVMLLFNLTEEGEGKEVKEVELINRIIFTRSFNKIMKFKKALDNSIKLSESSESSKLSESGE